MIVLLGLVVVELVYDGCGWRCQTGRVSYRSSSGHDAKADIAVGYALHHRLVSEPLGICVFRLCCVGVGPLNSRGTKPVQNTQLPHQRQIYRPQLIRSTLKTPFIKKIKTRAQVVSILGAIIRATRGAEGGMQSFR